MSHFSQALSFIKIQNKEKMTTCLFEFILLDSTCVQTHRMFQYSTPLQVAAVGTERNSLNLTERGNSPLTHEYTTHYAG